MHRGRIALGLITLSAFSVLVIGGIGPIEASATTSPSIQAQPSTNVADGQVISVTGAGFTPSAMIAVIECQTGATSESGCDLSTYELVSASATGSFSTPFIAERYLHLSNPSPTMIDCAVSGACILVAANYANTSEAAAIPLMFDPSAPPPPPLVIGGSLSSTGTVGHKSGVATLSGTVSCNRPVLISVFGQLSQTYHRFIFSSDFSSNNVLCTSSATWTIVVQPQNGLFGRGAASVSGYISGSVGGSSSQVDLSGTVTLQFPKN
jgi:hypothetical protein